MRAVANLRFVLAHPCVAHRIVGIGPSELRDFFLVQLSVDAHIYLAAPKRDDIYTFVGSGGNRVTLPWQRLADIQRGNSPRV